MDARVVSASHRQIAATRNAGAREAKGDLLIFVDADTRVNPEVVRAAYRDDERWCSSGGGAAVPVPGPAALVCQGARHPSRSGSSVRPVSPPAASSLLLVGLSEAVGGFDQSLYGAEGDRLEQEHSSEQGSFVGPESSRSRLSGRKFRAHTSWEMFAVMARLVLLGAPWGAPRDDMDFWYARGGKDPDHEHTND